MCVCVCKVRPERINEFSMARVRYYDESFRPKSLGNTMTSSRMMIVNDRTQKIPFNKIYSLLREANKRRRVRRIIITLSGVQSNVENSDLMAFDCTGRSTEYFLLLTLTTYK